jgi:hypothetical protein
MAKRFSRVNYHPRLHAALCMAVAMPIAVGTAMFVALFSPHQSLASSRASLSPDGIFKKYKSAVVRIEITLHGASLGVGSGYFISKSGEIVTSLHVVRPALVHPESEIKIKTALGTVLRNVKLGACSDARARMHRCTHTHSTHRHARTHAHTRANTHTHTMSPSALI